jgi:uncharacterized membrane protein
MGPEVLGAAVATPAELLRRLLEGLSVATVALGLAATGLACLEPRLRRRSPPSLAALRFGFGNWLCLALEFQLGADIVATTASPSRDNLIQLAVVAVIRTLLNVFLARELEAKR